MTGFSNERYRATRKLNSLARFITGYLTLESHHDSYSFFSTIAVDDYKSRFDTVRIYCELADESKVWEKWEKHAPQSELNGGSPSETFRSKCLLNDCVLYRNAYYDALALVPEFKDQLFISADYPVLLCNKVEQIIKTQENLGSYGPPEHAELKNLDFIRKVCVLSAWDLDD